MATNLLMSLMNEFRGDALNSVSSALGENPAKMTSALGGVLPALIGGLVNKVSTVEQAENLLGLIKRNNLDSGPFTNITSAMKQPDGISGLIAMGRPLVEGLFGGRTGSIIEWITSMSGISRTSSSSLMSLVLPLLLGQIGKQVGSMGGGASSLLSLLGDQKSFLRDAPAGLMSMLSGAASTVTGAVAAPVPAYATGEKRRTGRWLWAVAALVLIPLVLYFMGRGRSREALQSAADIPGAVATAGIAALGPFVDKTLPDNTSLHIPQNGVESKLLSYIQGSGQGANAQTWFSFDRLEFETDSARLTAGASEQLGNVAAIMRAYPNVKVEIGGYTDNTSDSAHNLELSRARASAAMEQIASQGIDRSRLSAEGYGEQNPVADNSTAEGRQRNRRVDIRVTDK